MSDNKNLLSEKKQSMLAELESIKSLLDDELDNIPVLQETVVEEDGIMTITPLQNLADLAALSDSIQNEWTEEPYVERSFTENVNKEHHAPTATQSDNGVLPGQQALFKERPTTKDFHERKKNLNKKNKASSKYYQENPLSHHADPTDDHTTMGASTSSDNEFKPQPSSDNPFLPEHIRHRLNGASGFVPEDPAMSTFQQAEQKNTHRDHSDRYLWPNKVPDNKNDNSQIAEKTTEKITKKIVEQVIAQYMPKIEADLRQKLYAALQLKQNNT